MQADQAADRGERQARRRRDRGQQCIRGIRQDLVDFVEEEGLRRKRDGRPHSKGALLNEALEQWRDRLDPLAKIRAQANQGCAMSA